MLSFLHIATISKSQTCEYEHLRLWLSWSVTDIKIREQFGFTPHFQVQSSEQQSFSRVFHWPTRSLIIMHWKAQSSINGKKQQRHIQPSTRDHSRGQARSAAFDPKKERELSSSHITILFHKDQDYQLLTNIVKNKSPVYNKKTPQNYRDQHNKKLKMESKIHKGSH